MNRSIFALILSTFALGLSEFMPMGFLPLISDGLKVSIPKSGMIISAFAIGVMVSSPIMPLLLSKLTRKNALITLLIIFTVGNFLSALSTSYTWLFISRIITSLSHGAFFGIGAIIAINITPHAKQAGAVSLMFSGLAIANIGGVPLAAWVGEIIGWRWAFAGTTFLGVVAIIALMINIPTDAKTQNIHIRRELATLIRPSILIIFAGTIFFGSSMFTLYTYLTVVLKNVTHASPLFIAIMFSLTGVGFTIGSILGGKLAIAWSPDKAITLFFLSAGIIMFIYPLVATTHIGAAIATLLWGITGYASSPLLQTKIVAIAKDAPALASSVNIGIFNLGNAIGAAVGGAVITAGIGYEWIAPVGGIISILGMASVLLPKLLNRKTLNQANNQILKQQPDELKPVESIN